MKAIKEIVAGCLDQVARASEKGTPKTLAEAIHNGLHEEIVSSVDGSHPRRAEIVEKHVRDFLSQKFGVAYLAQDDAVNPTIQALWTAITGEEAE